MRVLTLLTGLALAAAPALASEIGSGTYGATCASGDTLYRIDIRADGMADVQSGDTLFSDVLTSYSFYGDATPADFHIAIMFDGDKSPIASGKDGDARFEIWKGEAAYYALINGDKNHRLYFCSE